MSFDDLTSALRDHVDRGQLRGAIFGLRNGPHVRIDAIGDLGPDARVRIASLTKPMAAAVTLRLIEAGQLALTAEVDTWLPELANRRVLTAPDGPLTDTRPARRPILVEDLLTMRMGLGTMLRPKPTPLEAEMYARGVAVDIALTSPSRDDWLTRIADLPLFFDPGAAWMYDTSFVALGALLERVTGRTLADVFDRELVAPLGLRNTGFTYDRLPTAYARGQDGFRTVEPAGAASRFAKPPGFLSAAAGLTSTVQDYLRFMTWLGGDEAGPGLSRALREALVTDRIRRAHEKTSFSSDFWTHFGFGYGVGVVRKQHPEHPRGFGWDGGYGTTAYMDRETGSAAALFTQRLMDGPALPAWFRDFWRHVPWAREAW